MRISPHNLQAVASLTRDHRFIRFTEDVLQERNNALDAVLHCPAADLVDARARLVAATNLLNSITTAEQQARELDEQTYLSNTGNPDRVT